MDIFSSHRNQQSALPPSIMAERVEAYLRSEGPQSTCQVAVAFDIQYAEAHAVLATLEHHGRIVAHPVPRELRQYAEAFAGSQAPLLRIYEVVAQDSPPEQTCIVIPRRNA